MKLVNLKLQLCNILEQVEINQLNIIEYNLSFCFDDFFHRIILI